MKKTLLGLLLFGMLIVLCGCMLVPSAKLEAMFGTQENSALSAASTEKGNENGDTVTLSREEFEQYAQFSELVELIGEANLYFYKDFEQDKLLEYAAKGLMAGLGDPYSFYYSPKEYAEMWEDDEGNYTGIGVLISGNYTTQQCTISRVFSGSPAEAAGVQRGDILYRVEKDLYVTADNLQDAVDVMRGLPGTDVNVTFLRNGEEITFTITRQAITVNRIESTMLDDRVGYIVMYEFAGNSDQEFETALADLVDKGVKSLIIDLRDNPGGWVDQATHVADQFLDAGEACYLVYRNGEADHSQYLTYDGKVDLPLVLLVNENSASSSEILTGALKDRANATVVGVKSFGKGIVQGVWGVGSRGAGVQMTVAQYFTPNGNAVHEIGITPDVEVKLEEGDNGMYAFADLVNDTQLKKAYEVALEKLGK